MTTTKKHRHLSKEENNNHLFVPFVSCLCGFLKVYSDFFSLICSYIMRFGLYLPLHIFIHISISICGCFPVTITPPSDHRIHIFYKLPGFVPPARCFHCRFSNQKHMFLWFSRRRRGIYSCEATFKPQSIEGLLIRRRKQKKDERNKNKMDEPEPMSQWETRRVCAHNKYASVMILILKQSHMGHRFLDIKTR